MNGKINLEIYRVEDNKKVYDLSFNRNITLLNSNSANGKTTLLNIIRDKDYDTFKIDCEYECIYMDHNNYKDNIHKTEKIFFIDDQFDFRQAKDIFEIIKSGFNNYIVIVNRRCLSLSYSYKEIYELYEENGVTILRRKYDFIEDVLDLSISNEEKSNIVITEDSKSGNELINLMFSELIVSSGGKTNIINKLGDDKHNIIFADGASFGSEIDKLIKNIKINNISTLVYLPESIEYLILFSIFNYKMNLNEIDYSKYISWEKFFTDKLIELSITHFNERYNKAKLPNYVKDGINKIFNKIPVDIRYKLKKRIEEDVNKDILGWD